MLYTEKSVLRYYVRFSQIRSQLLHKKWVGTLPLSVKKEFKKPNSWCKAISIVNCVNYSLCRRLSEYIATLSSEQFTAGLINCASQYPLHTLTMARIAIYKTTFYSQDKLPGLYLTDEILVCARKFRHNDV